jgi:hypothetical protein
LAIVGFAVLAATAYAQARATAAVRLAARQRVGAAVEAALETVRGGAGPLSSGRFDVAEALELDGPDGRPTVEIVVRPTGVADLWTVVVRGRMMVVGDDVETTVWTQVWRP